MIRFGAYGFIYTQWKLSFDFSVFHFEKNWYKKKGSLLRLPILQFKKLFFLQFSTHSRYFSIFNVIFYNAARSKKNSLNQFYLPPIFFCYLCCFIIYYVFCKKTNKNRLNSVCCLFL